MSLHDVAFYTFEIWKSDLSQKADYGDVVDLSSISATLRLAPQALTIETGYRADFGLDLNGDPVIAEAGFGPGRWTIRGNYGVGSQGLKTLANNSDQGMITLGLDNRLAILAVLQNYADTNAFNLTYGKPLLKLVFKVLSGGPSEFKNQVWWILPLGMPTDERSATRPLDWSYSMTFWALKRVDQQVSATDMLNGLSLTSLMAIISQIKGDIQAIQQLLNFSQWPIVQTIQGVITGVQSAVNSANNLVGMVNADFQGASDLLRSASFALTSLIGTVEATANLPAQAQQDLIQSLTYARVSIGQSLLSITANGELTSTPPAPAPIPVIPNRDLRMIAATVLGDASLWTTIAAQNDLVYPFVSWPAGGPAASPSGLIPGTVAAPGGLLTATPGASQAILDPAGMDLDPSGGDFLVGGIQNIVNALNRRLNTPLGYLPQHPNYGSSLNKWLGEPLTVDNALAIRGEVSRVLLSDPRVTTITAITLETDGEQSVSVNAIAQTILGPAAFAVTGGS